MKLSIKIISGFVSVSLLIILGGYAFMGFEGVKDLTGIDLTNCTYHNTNGSGTTIIQFSLQDSIYFIISAILIVIAFCGWVLLQTSKFISYIKIAFYESVWIGKQFVKDIWQSELKFFLLLPLLAYVYFAFTIPITHDEATTYIFYINCSLLDTISCYTLPNNHILYSLAGHIFTKIPFFDLLFTLRLSSVFFALLTQVAIYRFVHKFYGRNVSLTVVALTSVVSMVMLYSFFARGYILLLLLFVICLHASYNIVNAGNRKRDWLIFTASAILGFYTMPSFLYPFLTINLYIFYQNYKSVAKQIFYNLLVVFGTLILYLPVLIVTGFKSLAGNDFVTPLNRLNVLQRLPGFIKGTMGELFELHPYIVIALLAVLILYAIYRKDKKTLMLWVIFIFTPFILLILHSVIPFFRSFAYYGFLFPFLAGITFRENIVKLKPKLLITLLLVVQVCGIFLFKQHVYRRARLFAEEDVIIKHVLDSDKKYYLQLSFLHPNLLFELQRHNYKGVVKSMPEQHFIDSDTLQGFDYIILDAEYDKTQYHNPTYSKIDFREREVNIYKR